MVWGISWRGDMTNMLAIKFEPEPNPLRTPAAACLEGIFHSQPYCMREGDLGHNPNVYGTAPKTHSGSWAWKDDICFSMNTKEDVKYSCLPCTQEKWISVIILTRNRTIVASLPTNRSTTVSNNINKPHCHVMPCLPENWHFCPLRHQALRNSSIRA